ncbi:MAG: DinB family protein, partial [Catalinimonas sp.]
MMPLNATEHLERQGAALHLFLADVQALRRHPAPALRHRPALGAWNALECLAHLNLTADVYLPNIAAVLDRAPRHADVPPFRPSRLVQRVADGLAPIGPNRRIRFPMPALPSLRPRGVDERSAGAVIDDCLARHRMLLYLLVRAREVDLNRGRVDSVVGPLVRFRLGDVFPFLTAHAQRHLLQAERAVT